MTSIPPSPRMIRPVRERPVLRMIGWALAGGVVVLTVLLTLTVVHEVLFRLTGRDVTAEVASLHEHPNRWGTFDRVVHYSYTLPGHPLREDHSLISWREFQRLSKAFLERGERREDMIFGPGIRESLAVRAYEWGPLHSSRAVAHAWSGMFLWVPALFMGVFGGLSLVIYRAAIVLPRRLRRLYTHGAAVTGEIVGKEQHHRRHNSWYVVDYDFTPASGAGVVQGRALIGAREFERVTPGEVVIVLYDADEPTRNTVYEYGGYCWV